jgi:hypothetical protein
VLFLTLFKAIMWMFRCLCMWSILTYRLIQLHRQIYAANMALSYFLTKSWVFTNDKLLWQITQVPPCDRKHLQLDRMKTIDTTAYFKNACWEQNCIFWRRVQKHCHMQEDITKGNLKLPVVLYLYGEYEIWVLTAMLLKTVVCWEVTWC